MEFVHGSIVILVCRFHQLVYEIIIYSNETNTSRKKQTNNRKWKKNINNLLASLSHWNDKICIHTKILIHSYDVTNKLHAIRKKKKLDQPDCRRGVISQIHTKHSAYIIQKKTAVNLRKMKKGKAESKKRRWNPNSVEIGKRKDQKIDVEGEGTKSKKSNRF